MIEGTENADQQNADQQNGEQGRKVYSPPATQADLDRIVESRLAKERAKYAGYHDFKAKAERLDQAEEAAKTELQKAQDAAAAAEKRATDAEAKALRGEIAAARGVPAALLSGSTQEELEAAADALLAFKGPGDHAPSTPGDGEDVNARTDDRSARELVAAALGRK